MNKLNLLKNCKIVIDKQKINQLQEHQKKQMSLEDFQIIEKLGSGAFSSVYKVRRIQDKEVYAMKKINYFRMKEKQQQNSLNEVRILASIKHDNIIGYRQTFFDQQTKCLYLIMQFAPEGDLYKKIVQKSKLKQHFEEEQIWDVLIDLLKGLKSLHDKNIVHRDLKSANIFLMGNKRAKLGDMNVSKIAQHNLCTTQTGTPYYASPEIWKDEHYGTKSDIWSLGCVIYEMAALHPPFEAEDMMGLYKKVTKGIYPKLPTKYSADLNDIIRILLQVDPFRRPSCDKILKLKVIAKRFLYQRNKLYKEQNQQLLETIRLPTQLSYFKEKLPESNYFSPKNKHIFHNSVNRINKILPKDQNIFILPRLVKDKKRTDWNRSLVIEKRDKLGQSQIIKEKKMITEKQADQILQDQKIKKMQEKSLPVIKKKQQMAINLDEKLKQIKKIYKQPIKKRNN